MHAVAALDIADAIFARPVEVVFGDVPHPQRIADGNDRAIEASPRIVRATRWAGRHNHWVTTALLAPDQMPAQAGRERDAHIVKGEQHGLLDLRIWDTVQHFDHGRSFLPGMLVGGNATSSGPAVRYGGGPNPGPFPGREGESAGGRTGAWIPAQA